MKYTLAFDIYGTLINTSGVFESLQKLIGDKAEPFMHTWRNKQLEYSFRRGLMGKYVDFSVCTKDALNFCCQMFEIEMSEAQQTALMLEYTVLPIFPDVKNGLTELKKSGYQIYAFSNGSMSAVSNLLTNAEIIDFFDGIVSANTVESFKPNPLVYQHLSEQIHTEKQNCWLISSNPFDVIGAISYGMPSAWLQRSPKSIFDPWGIAPTITINQLTELNDVLAERF